LDIPAFKHCLSRQLLQAVLFFLVITQPPPDLHSDRL